MKFEWDKNKNVANIRKHGVSFEEAESVFYDPLAKVADDPDHSDHEDRFFAIGHSNRHRKLLVVHCYKEAAYTIRIISARTLTRSERRQYEEML